MLVIRATEASGAVRPAGWPSGLRLRPCKNDRPFTARGRGRAEGATATRSQDRCVGGGSVESGILGRRSGEASAAAPGAGRGRGTVLIASAAAEDGRGA